MPLCRHSVSRITFVYQEWIVLQKNRQQLFIKLLDVVEYILVQNSRFFFVCVCEMKYHFGPDSSICHILGVLYVPIF